MRTLPSVKLAATSSETRWSQAYSTLNLYIVLHIAQDGDVAKTGKEMLERLQREYFAEDTKNLEAIKSVVSRVASSFEGREFSITLLTVIDGIAYIVVASCGKVALLRGDTFAFVAEEAQDSVESFSGRLSHGDTVILGTCDFFKKITPEKLSLVSSGMSLEEISETLAPEIHTNSTGGEAAVVLRFEDEARGEQVASEHTEEEVPPAPQLSDTKRDKRFSLPFSLPQINLRAIFDFLKRRRRESIIFFAIFVLLCVFAFLLIQDRGSRVDAALSAEYASVSSRVEEHIEDAEAVSTIDRHEALAHLLKAEELLLESKSDFEGSTYHSQIETLLADVLARQEKLSGVERVSLQEFYAADFSPHLSITGENIVALGDGTLAVLSASGSQESEVEVFDESVVSSVSSDNFVYALTDSSVMQVDLGNFEESEIVEHTGALSIALFSSNVYLLYPDRITKYTPPTYDESEYFSENAPSRMSNFAIDGSVYVVADNTLLKYLRGVRDEFEIQNLTTPLGPESLIHTNPELENVYVLDPENSRVVVLDDAGSVLQQLSAREFSNATSFVVNPSEETGYVTVGNTIYSFSL